MIVDVSALPKNRVFDALEALIMNDDCVVVGTMLEWSEDLWIVEPSPWADELLAGIDLDDKSKWLAPLGPNIERELREALVGSDERYEGNMRWWLVSEMDFEEGEG